jgi:hypothetical protein
LPDGEVIDQLDDFIIDNAVMSFKTPTGAQPPVPPVNKGGDQRPGRSTATYSSIAVVGTIPGKAFCLARCGVRDEWREPRRAGRASRSSRRELGAR